MATDTAVLTLTDFVLARIAEDEARADHTSAPYTMHWPNCDFPGDMPGVCTCDLRARVLAECEAKRRIVDRHSRCDDVSFGDSSTCPDMRDLAAIHGDHLDYRDEWRY